MHIGDSIITIVTRMLNADGTIEVVTMMMDTTVVGDGTKIADVAMMTMMTIIHPVIRIGAILTTAIPGGLRCQTVRQKWRRAPFPLVAKIVMRVPDDYFFCQCSTIRCSSPPGAQMTKAWTGFLEVTL